jgi:hypothetical protein
MKNGLLSKDVQEIDRLAQFVVNLRLLVRIKYVVHVVLSELLGISSEFNGREEHLWLLDIVVYFFSKVVRHVGLHYHREMITVPLVCPIL